MLRILKGNNALIVTYSIRVLINKPALQHNQQYNRLGFVTLNLRSMFMDVRYNFTTTNADNIFYLVPK